MIPFDECQMKSLQEMNTLFKAILKLCLANQLFKFASLIKGSEPWS